MSGLWPRNESKAAGIYRRLLALYPRAFRERYGEEMAATFEQRWNELTGLGARLNFTVRLAVDGAASLASEWLVVCRENAGVMAVVILLVALAAGLAAAGRPHPWLQALGLALLSGAFGAWISADGRRTGWRGRLGLVALGFPLGLALALFAGLKPDLPEMPRVDAVAGPSLGGPAIYARMLAAYRGASTYVDSGELVVAGRMAPGVHEERQSFSTVFVRGEGFRYQSRRKDDPLRDWTSYVRWRSDRDAGAWSSDVYDFTRSPRTLADAVSTASFYSHGAASYLPSLLALNGAPFYGLSGVVLTGRTVLDGQPVFELEGTRQGWGRVALWIDQKSLLVLRIDAVGAYHSSAPEHQIVIVHRPRLNEAVDPAMLTFHSPAPPTVWGHFFDGRNRLLLLLFVPMGLAGPVVSWIGRKMRGRALASADSPQGRRLSGWTRQGRFWFGVAGVWNVSLGLIAAGVPDAVALNNMMLGQFALMLIVPYSHLARELAGATPDGPS